MPNTHSFDCTSAMRQLWDYLDDELTEDRMRLIHEHLAKCKDCHPHAHFASRFLAAVRQTREDAPLPDSLRERVRRALGPEPPGLS
jgi:anti-sigma factor (TIGR02949 family)